MNPPLKRIPVIIPLMMIISMVVMIVIGCRITDLKLDVKEIQVKQPKVTSP